MLTLDKMCCETKKRVNGTGVGSMAGDAAIPGTLVQGLIVQNYKRVRKKPVFSVHLSQVTSVTLGFPRSGGIAAAPAGNRKKTGGHPAGSLSAQREFELLGWNTVYYTDVEDIVIDDAHTSG